MHEKKFPQTMQKRCHTTDIGLQIMNAKNGAFGFWTV